MSSKTLEETKTFIKQFKAKYLSDAISIQLHGGEPCLYNLDDIIHLVKELQDQQCKFSITTNLVYNITKKHIDLFKLMLPYGDQPYIMTSWDYGIRFNDQQLKLWETNVKYLLKQQITVQPIICVTKQLIKNISPKELFEYFSNLGINDINFERITSTGKAAENDVRPTNRDTDDWLYKAFLKYENNSFHIPLFGNLKETIFGHFNGCRARKCMKTVTTINPDGTVATCPNMPTDIIGTISNLDESKRACLCNKEKFARFQTCSICKYFKYCNGECCQLEDDETGCPGLKNILKHITHI